MAILGETSNCRVYVQIRNPEDKKDYHHFTIIDATVSEVADVIRHWFDESAGSPRNPQRAPSPAAAPD